MTIISLSSVFVRCDSNQPNTDNNNNNNKNSGFITMITQSKRRRKIKLIPTTITSTVDVVTFSIILLIGFLIISSSRDELHVVMGFVNTARPSFAFLSKFGTTKLTKCKFNIIIQQSQQQQSLLNMIYAPPGSGYQSIEDEKSELPATYEPMMAYPGTMRPGMTPENMPFQDLPIGDNDPDPVPWPHFQQHEWHTTIWSQYPPHDHPVPMEEFIAIQNKWATPEMEASMRAGVRKDVRQRVTTEETSSRENIITDDDDDDDIGFDDDFVDTKVSIALGDNIFGKLGSDADRALTAAATTAPDPSKKKQQQVDDDDDDLLVFDEDDDDLDDFLLDLGLDAELDLGGDDLLDTDASNKGVGTATSVPPISVITSSNIKPKKKLETTGTASSSTRITVDEDEEDDEVDELLGPLALGTLGLDDDDDIIDADIELGGGSSVGGVNTVPLEDFGDNDGSMLDGMEDNIFDEGGFDFGDDDYGGGGGGDDIW